MITMKYRLQFAYTLIEIMIALLIFTILTSIVSMSLSNAIRAYQGQDHHHSKLLQLQQALTLLQHDIQQVIPRSIYDATGIIYPPLYFDNLKLANYLEFTRNGRVNPHALEKRSNLQRVAYYWNDNKLIRRRWQQVDRWQQEQAVKQIVLENVSNIQWEFYDETNKAYRVWPPISKWQNRLPAGVGITLEVDGWGEIQRLFVLPENIE